MNKPNFQFQIPLGLCLFLHFPIYQLAGNLNVQLRKIDIWMSDIRILEYSICECPKVQPPGLPQALPEPGTGWVDGWARTVFFSGFGYTLLNRRGLFPFDGERLTVFLERRLSVTSSCIRRISCQKSSTVMDFMPPFDHEQEHAVDKADGFHKYTGLRSKSQTLRS